MMCGMSPLDKVDGIAMMTKMAANHIYNLKEVLKCVVATQNKPFEM